MTYDVKKLTNRELMDGLNDVPSRARSPEYLEALEAELSARAASEVERTYRDSQGNEGTLDEVFS